MDELFFKVALIINKELYDIKKIDFELFQNAENYLLNKIKVKK